MAYTANELYSSVAGKGSVLRGYPTVVQPKTFGTGTALLAALTPVAFNTTTGFFVLYQNGGANGAGTIAGFIWPDAVQLVSGSEVLGQVLLEGRIHINDIPIVTGYTLAQLQADIITSLVRNKGIIIEGMANFR